MFPFRRSLFSLAGGFMITDFYVNCVNITNFRLEPLPTIYVEDKKESTSNSKSSIIYGIARRVGMAADTYDEMPITSLRDDIEMFMQRNTLVGAMVVCTLVSFGGLWSLLGSASAIAFDGESGSYRYAAVKDWLSR
ncbi:uncharacterized protein TM35_000062360 [Trypanosoma theileri]|uniref:Uncharacterized protein n=1 Tax=Trypanosoma theileri TaxID=67003 RepID=A0A1X0P305_9TRYP|nr:uncharacterized protein TM35_000062360 [Trypanosoma theileri]ORC91231.1 hypothetical protein TM35_000062360 [Trypanosoma theileri]